MAFYFKEIKCLYCLSALVTAFSRVLTKTGEELPCLISNYREKVSVSVTIKYTSCVVLLVDVLYEVEEIG